MKFCRNCGEQLPGNAEFCTSCGEQFPKGETSSQDYKPSESVEPRPPRKPMNTKTKILVSSGLALLVIIMGTHMFLKNMYNPEKKIEAMNLAYHGQDQEAFYKQFTIKEGTIGNAKNLYAAVKSYGWNDLRTELEKEALIASTNSKNVNIITAGYEFISVTSTPVFLGLYKDITFTILPSEVTVTVPYKDTALTFGGQEYKTTADDEEITLGKFIPGEYEWSYTTPGPLMPLSSKGKYTVEGDEENEDSADLDWNIDTLRVDSNVGNAIVFIDGKSTKKTVDELYELYPAQLNKDVKIHAVTKDKKGTEVSSNIVPAAEDTIYLTFAHAEAEQKAEEQKQVAAAQTDVVRELFRSFRDEYEYAISYIDFSYIEDYFMEGSKIRQDYAKFVVDHRNIPGYYYEFLLNDITSVNQLSDNKYELLSFETFNFYSNADGGLHYERKKKYIFKKVGDEFFIESITNLDTKKTKI